MTTFYKILREDEKEPDTLEMRINHAAQKGYEILKTHVVKKGIVVIMHLRIEIKND